MNQYRQDFPLLRNADFVYLDNAATSQRPDAVIEAEKHFYERLNANPLRGFYDLAQNATESYEQAREKTRAFLNAKSAREIVFTRNTTESINLVAYSWALERLTDRDEILITISEHHSNILPWQMAARKTGAKLSYLFCEPDGSYPEERVRAAVTDRVKLAAIGQVSNVTGRLGPVALITELVHQNGGVVLVDAAQSAPHGPVDVQALDVDFLALSGHKMLAPMGIGVLYGKERLLEEMSPFLTGGEMIDSVRLYDATYAELPHKFEAGTVNAGAAAGLGAAIDYLQDVGFARIREIEDRLTSRALSGMQALPGVHVIGSDRAEEHNGILAFTVDNVHPHDISAILNDDRVCIRAGHHCAQPLHKHLGIRSSARASFYFYNTEEDVDRFLESVAGIRRRMGLG
ncbi:MAG: SufS family cysteine desulfurase [Clostridia bacterium]|nr:SufS family cysteine desulfurase [Clostridia bacterium]